MADPDLGNCHNWTGKVTKRGYGRMSITTTTEKGAHVVAWELEKGPLPPGRRPDHMCSNRRCVRVSHMRLATPGENSQHMTKPGRWGDDGEGRGVSFHTASGRWRARVHFQGKEHTSYHDTVGEARTAAKAKRLELFTFNRLDRL